MTYVIAVDIRSTCRFLDAVHFPFLQYCIFLNLPASPVNVVVVQIVDSGFSEVFPLWALSSVAKGGLESSTNDIAQVRFLRAPMRFLCTIRVLCVAPTFTRVELPHPGGLIVG